MATNPINSISIPVGTLAGTLNTPLWRVPKSTSAFGGITLTGAYIVSSGGTLTSEMQLLSGTVMGTAFTGTIGTCNATLAASVPKAFTISTAYVSSGSWIHLKLNAGQGALTAATNVTLEYVWGK